MSDLNGIDRGNAMDLDLGDAEFKANARRHLSEWARRPPFYVFGGGPVQVIAGRYRDVEDVFSDAERFSSHVPFGPGYEQFDKFMGARFITQMDGEQHARLRRLMMPAFGARRMQQLDERIGQIIDGLLDDIERGGRQFDGMQDYGAKLVIGTLLTAMLDLDAAGQQVLIDFQTVLPRSTATRPGEPWPEEALAAYRKMGRLIEAVIDDRRVRPRSDFLSDLVSARDAGDALGDRELFDQIFGIFAAIASTSRAAGGALYMLYTHRDQLAELIEDPSQVPDAVEECLRIAGNGYFTFPRVATRDTELGGTRILEGMIIRPSPQAANYDPDVFPDPLRFDIHRKPKRIMTFGAGPHHCIGRILARATLTTAISRLLARFPNARLANPDFVPEYGGAVGELRMKGLPMLTH